MSGASSAMLEVLQKKSVKGNIQQNKHPVLLSTSKIRHTAFIILLFLISSRNEGSKRNTCLNRSAGYRNDQVAH